MCAHASWVSPAGRVGALTRDVCEDREPVVLRVEGAEGRGLDVARGGDLDVQGPVQSHVQVLHVIAAKVTDRSVERANFDGLSQLHFFQMISKPARKQALSLRPAA